MKSGLFILIVFGFLNTANADLGGSWVGWAYWKYMGDGPKCSANLNFEESEETFSLLAGDLDCDIVAMEIPERLFTKKDGELLLDGAPAGKFTENSYEWTERYNERTVINVSIKVNGTNLDYVEHWIQDEDTLLYDISGRLFKK